MDLIQQSVPVVDVIFPTAKTKKLIADLNHKPRHLRDLHDWWSEHQENEGRAVRTTDTIKHRLVDFLRMFGDDSLRITLDSWFLNREDMMPAAHIHGALRNGRRGHQDFAHVVGGQQLELRACLNYENIAVFAG